MEKKKYYTKVYFMADKGLSDYSPKVFGYEYCRPGYGFGPNARPYYLIHYVVSGKGTLWARGQEYKISENQAFLIKPNELSRYQADEECPWHYIWVGFTGTKAQDFEKLPSPVIDVETELFLQMMHIEYLNSTQEEFIAGKMMLYHSLIFDFLKKPDHVSRAMNYIDASYNTSECTVENVAKKINLEKHYLARIFKQKTGKSVKDYILEKRMKNAEILLKNGYDIKTVSQLSGYSDQFAFSKAFKKTIGISPSKVPISGGVQAYNTPELTQF